MGTTPLPIFIFDSDYLVPQNENNNHKMSFMDVDALSLSNDRKWKRKYYKKW